ncbi:hypothetical protein TNIN_363601 [Trichonephila inaurata madagascariensis]|uniref:Uncharacterized protein n=1 Tax=Trichonephila inaurata madagascariensis TaxID=2747483 RepID=A0A8X7BXS8_9ARAC|nr:hypothetical protein TNIN_363601 [Trichonephila inaurata madagascariensis]
MPLKSDRILCSKLGNCCPIDLSLALLIFSPYYTTLRAMSYKAPLSEDIPSAFFFILLASRRLRGKRANDLEPLLWLSELFTFVGHPSPGPDMSWRTFALVSHFLLSGINYDLYLLLISEALCWGHKKVKEKRNLYFCGR